MRSRIAIAKRYALLVACIVLGITLSEGPPRLLELLRSQLQTIDVLVAGAPSFGAPAAVPTPTIEDIRCGSTPASASFPRDAARHFPRSEFYCSIETDLRRNERHKASDLIATALPGVRVTAFSLRVDASEGDTAVALLKLAACAVLILLYQRVFGWRADLKNAFSGIRAVPHVMVWPILIGLVVSALDPILATPLNVFAAHGPASSVVLGPVYEELLYRWLLFALLCRYCNEWMAAIIASALFAIAHQFDIALLAQSFAIAMVLQVIFIRYASILLCIASHALLNAVVLVRL